MPFPVPASKNICQISKLNGVIDNIQYIKQTTTRPSFTFNNNENAVGGKLGGK
jgi:hypothetical protein